MTPTRDIEVTCITCGTKFSCTYEEEVHFVCLVCQVRTSLQTAEAMVREAEELIRALYDVIVRRVAKIDSELFDLLFETLSFLKMLGVQLPPEEKP